MCDVISETRPDTVTPISGAECAGREEPAGIVTGRFPVAAFPAKIVIVIVIEARNNDVNIHAESGNFHFSSEHPLAAAWGFLFGNDRSRNGVTDTLRRYGGLPACL